MMQLQEGKICFLFAEGVLAAQYDAWSFYRNQFENGCASGNKAVDFVCVADKVGWLIEVKDYRQHSRTKAVELCDEIASKVRDSLAGLAAAQTMANSDEEKKFAQKLLRAKKVRVACHLEQAAKSSRLRPNAIEADKLQDQLRRRLKALDPHPLVLSTATQDNRVPWQSRSN